MLAFTIVDQCARACAISHRAFTVQAPRQAITGPAPAPIKNAVRSRPANDGNRVGIRSPRCAVALRDFDPAYVGLGSCVTSIAGLGENALS